MARDPFSDASAILIAVLAESRKAADLTQVDLANLLSRPQSYVSKIERGERRMDVIEFCAFARAIGVKPATLLAKIDAQLPDPLVG